MQKLAICAIITYKEMFSDNLWFEIEAFAFSKE